MELIFCPETSIRNYHHSLRNNPEERSFHPLRGRSLKSPTIIPTAILNFLNSDRRADMANCAFTTKVEKKKAQNKSVYILRAIWLLATNYLTYHYIAF
jgi:hypothetical protein